jgi:uncharacterized protein YjdB
MKPGSWLSPLAIVSGMFLTALLVLSDFTANAQVHLNTAIKNQTVIKHVADQLPAIIVGTGSPTTVCSSSTVYLSDATAGGSWSSNNTSVATVFATAGGATVSLFAPGSANIYYMLGSYATVITVVYTAPIAALPSYSVCVGNSVTLSDPTPTGIWSSSSNSVATVSPAGLLQALSAGTTVISYGRTGACVVTNTITVVPNNLASITGPSSPLAICLSSNAALSDATAPGGGIWSSSNTTVATISNALATNGIAYSGGVNTGTSIITYSMGNCFVTAPLMVNSSTAIAGITGSPTVCLGNVDQLSDATSFGVWSSSNSSIAYVNSAGGVTANSVGSASIIYTKGGCSGTPFPITVTANGATLTGNTNVCRGGTTVLTGLPAGGTWSSNSTSITVSGGIVSAAAGSLTGYANITYYAPGGCYQTAAVTANTVTIPAISGPSAVCMGSNVRLTDGTPGGVWSSATSGVATVDAYGNLYGSTAGADVVTYNLLGCTQSTNITVNPLPSAITGVMSACAGTTTTLSDAIVGGNWSSSNTAVATVVSATGVVTGVAAGTSIITYTLPTGCYSTNTVTVNSLPAITGGNTVCVGTGAYPYLELHDATTGGTWTSSNTLYATVGAGTGTVTGLAVGSVIISYTKTGCSVTQAVTVGAIAAPITGSYSGCAGSTITLTDASGPGVWSSSVTSVATVSATGVVYNVGAAVGGSSITFNYAGCLAVANINFVAPPAAITGPIPSAPFSVCTGLGTIVLTDATTGGAWTINNNYATLTTSGFPVGGPSKVQVMGYTLPTGVSFAPCIVSYTLNGCSVTTTVNVTANPVATIAGDPYVCTGQTNTSLIDGLAGGTWSSSNTAFATIDVNTGVVTGVAAGNPIITYTVAGGCFKTMPFAVNTTPPAITGSISVCTASTTQLSDALSGGGWTTSDPALANVTSAGLVSGVAQGTATITYSIGGCMAYRPITVGASLPAIGGTGSVCTSFTTTLSDATTGGVWSSSNNLIATVGSATGVVSGVAAGAATITYSLYSCYVTKAVTDGYSAPTAIITPGTTAVCANNTLALSDATPGGFWTASNTAASVSTGGLVTGLNPGAVTITYFTFSGCPAQTAAITVNPVPSAISGTMSLCSNGTTNLADVYPGGVWSSTNTTLATVAAGVVSGIAAGTDSIKFTDPVTGCFTGAIVTINPAVGAITGAASVCMNQTTALADVTSGGAWTSSNTSFATVDPVSGVVTGVAVGAPVITYMTPTGCFSTLLVNVLATPGPVSGISTTCVGNATTLSDATSAGAWTSSNTSMATVVSGTGVVTGVSAGAVTITYTVSGCSVTQTVLINANPQITGIVPLCSVTPVLLSDAISGGAWTSTTTTVATIDPVSGSITGVSDGTSVITYTQGICYTTSVVSVGAFIPAITGLNTVCVGNPVTLSNSEAGGTWSSSSTTLATVSALGVVSGIAAGGVNISYTHNGCAVVQAQTVNASIGSISGLTLICVGSASTLSDNISGGNWSSSNSALATVDPVSGVVTGVANGTPVITYGLNSCYLSQAVTIGSTTPGAIAGATSTVCSGATFTLSDATLGGLWGSDNTAVATVSGTGVVTGVSGGSANIDYYYVGGCAGVTKAISVYATPAAITGNLNVCVGGTTTLSDSYVGAGTWTSSSTTLATVSAVGVVTGGSAGTPIVTFKETTHNCAVTTTVTVNPLPTAILGTGTACVGLTTLQLSDATSGGTWTSANTTIVNVSAGGWVAGVAAGTANVSYVLTTGCGVAYAVTVNAVPGSITAASFNVCKNLTITLADATSGGTWSSSDNTLATVDPALGIVYPVTPNSAGLGSPTISYTIPSTGCYVTKSISIGDPNTTAPYGPNQVCVNGQIILNDAYLGGAWSTSNTTVASVITWSAPAEIIQGLSVGTAVITYTPPGCTALTFNVSVLAATAPITGPSFSVCRTLSVTLSDATTGGTWTSSNTSIATIDPILGVVGGATVGAVTITYTGPGGCAVTQAFNVIDCGLKMADPTEVSDVNAVQAYTLYPNPTSGNIMIQQSIPENSGMEVTVMNCVGAIVYTGNIDFAGGVGKLDISDVSSGMYLVRLKNKTGELHNFKVIVQK